MDYRGGQFAELELDSLPGLRRNYSFADAGNSDGRLSFFVRQVPNGAFSTAINQQDLVGQALTVSGPAGEFWLRPGGHPLLLVAGGSGLAPILALLREALAAGCTRSVTLLFGARSQEDLYALYEISDLQHAWSGRFRFLPVLSQEPDAGDWGGARGLVTDFLAEHLEPGAEVYLCGPPAMVDAAERALRTQKVPAARIHADRFLSAADQTTPAASVVVDLVPSQLKRAGLLDYLKFFLFHGLGLTAFAMILAGGHYPTIGLVSVLAFYVLGDALAGEDLSTPNFAHPGILTAQLWLALPLLATIVFAGVWSVSPGDPLGFGQFMSALAGMDVLAARQAMGLGDQVSVLVLTGLMIGMIGTITAHELTHRTWDPVSMLIGRWLLAFSFDTSFSIEHVYGHHRYVSTEHDPATAPRGRNVYAHILISTVRGNVSAWQIERRRLRRNGLSVWSWRSAFLRGHLMSGLLVLAAWAMGGAGPALFFVGCALWGKALLEIVNYMEHYGMVRDPATPVQPRHSWNTTRKISSWTMFNLTRHSHHHAQGEVPYHALQPFPDAPQMIGGYLTTILVTLVPPLWYALMTPKVLAWDRHYASPGERELILRANARSGLRGMQMDSAL